MPEARIPNQPPDVNFDSIPMKSPSSDLSSDEAVGLVTQSFSRFEQASRRADQEARWLRDDELYMGYVPQRYWQGTKQPRSSLGIPVSFDQVETLLPSIEAEILGREPYWFDTEATETSNPQEARAVQMVLARHLDEVDPMNGFMSPETQIRACFKEYLLHGNCVCRLGWNNTRERLTLEWVPLKDFYLDPDMNTPVLEAGSGVIHRRLTTVKELQKLRGLGDEWSVPPDDILYGLTKEVPGASADKVLDESLLNRRRSEEKGSIVNPADRKIEVLEYYNADRMIWVLNRKWALTNQRNPYRMVPYVWAPLYLVLGEAYGMSIPDVIGGDQMLIQGIVNARIDELSLALSPPRIVDRSSTQTLTRNELAWAPGKTFPSERAKDTVIAFPQNSTQNSFAEVSLAEARVEKRTGASRFLQMGTPQPSNANRTATGVQGQLAAINTRLRTPVKNLEDYFLVPLLYKAHSIIARFSDQNRDSLPGKGLNGQNIQVPRVMVNSFVRFRMTAASSMITRDRILQLLGPFTQLFQSQSFQEALRRSNKIVDPLELIEMSMDGFNLSRKYSLVRDMTEQEAQQAQQPDPNVAAQLQQKQQELQTRMMLGQLKSQTDIRIAEIEAQSGMDQTEEKEASNILREEMKRRGSLEVAEKNEKNRESKARPAKSNSKS